MRIKVCGMRDIKNIRDLVRYQPDYIGFIFYPSSKRYMGEELNNDILKVIPDTINKVGVFVNERLEKVINIVSSYGLDYVQLHGEENPGYCIKLKENGIKVVKTFSVDGQLNNNILKDYKPHVDFFLFDTETTLYGGSGRKFDWNLLKEYDNEIPFFLSGGIGMDSIGDIENTRYMNIEAIDVNSRFEKKPGVKNIETLELFIEKIKEI